MVYANDQWVLLPTRDLYDTQMMAIAINAAKDMYEKGQQEIKDFNKLYGDFMTPIAKDQDWYNQNVISPLRNTINAIYAAGGDPLRNPEARALISRTINNIDKGAIAKLKLSAENYREYKKNRAALERTGLYNARFDNTPSALEYSTLGENGQGVWSVDSPIPIQDMSTFTKPWYEGIQPRIVSTSKDGISYATKVISPEDLKNVAVANYNDIISTPQGRAMYDTFLRETGNADKAKKMMIDQVVAGNLRRLRNDSDYDDAKHQQLLISRANLALNREEFAWKKLKELEELDMKRQAANNVNPGDEGFSWTGRTYEDAIANAANDGLNIYNTKDPSFYNQASKNIGQVQIDFGNKFVGKGNLTLQQIDKKKDVLRKKLLFGKISKFKYDAEMNELSSPITYSDIKTAYQNKFTTNIDAPTFIAWHGGLKAQGDNTSIVLNSFDMRRLYDEDHVVTTTMGYRKQHRGDNSQLRNEIIPGSTMTPTGECYGAVMKDGAFHIYARVIINSNGVSKSAYYDMGAQSAARKGGAYTKNIKTGGKFVGGDIGKRQPFSGANRLVPEITPIQYQSGESEQFNLIPDYSLWGNYGPADIRANAYLKTKASEYNAGY